MKRLNLVALLWSGILLCVLALASASSNRILHAATNDKADSELYTALATQARVRVLVQLQSPANAVGAAATDAIAALQQSVLDSLPAADFQLNRRYQTLAALALDIDSNSLAALQANPNVVAVALDHPGSAQLSQSVPALHADIVSNTYGITGKGIIVAVLDTGIDTNHVDLQDAIVAQHCFTANNCQPGNVAESSNAQDLNGHGTNVSGIITSNGEQAPHGFAVDAKIVAVRVLDQSSSGWVSDWVAGLDWLTANYATQPVDIVNMSLGTFALYSTNCDASESTMATAVANLRAKGVVFFASSGNQASSTQISSPACNSGVIAVGATYDSNVGREPDNGTYSSIFGSGVNCFDATTGLNTITCFSNSNAQLDLLAPGAPIESTGLGGGTSIYYGTSQASPTAAAIAALMLEKDPTLTPDEVEMLLKSSGIKLTDSRNNLVVPRIDALTAVNAIDFYHHIAPTAVALSGPTDGALNTSYRYTATVSPISTTLPITYSWWASDFGTTHVFTDDLSAAVDFAWSSPGSKEISVTAENLYGLVTASMQITIHAPAPTALSGLVLQGATTGVVGEAQPFTATVTPADATLPISYSWQAAGQAPLIHTGGVSDQASFTWSQPGTYSLVVTATNAGNVVVSDTLVIGIASISPESVSLKGAPNAQVNESVPFLASVSPATTQTPVTYTWTASEQTAKIRVGGLQDSVTFKWPQAGVYTVAVSADNGLGVVSNSRMITVSAVEQVVALQDVSLTGPDSGDMNQLLHFTATVEPENASSPISYTWEAAGQSSVTQVTGSSTSLVFSWPQTGTFPITVTASNISGTAQAVHVVEIRAVAPLAMIIDGPDLVNVDEVGQFIATMLPNNVSLPITYEWSATDQLVIIEPGELSDQVQYQWHNPGTITIHVKASNGAGEISGEKMVEVVRLENRTYLPIVER